MARIEVGTYEATRVKKIFLDDVEQKYVVKVDADNGWLIRFCSDENDKPIVAGDELAKEKVTGNIRVEMKAKNEQ